MRPHVVVVMQIVVEDVLDEAAEDGDVASGPDLQVLVGHGRRPGESRVDGDEGGPPVVTGLDGPLEPARVVLGRVGPHHQDDIGILDVLPVVGHRPATERGGQTGHRGAVSYAGLMVDIPEAHRPHRLGDEIGVLVGDGRAPHPGDAVAAVDDASLVVALRERGVP